MNPYPPDHRFAADIAVALTISLDLPHLKSVVAAHVAELMDDPRLVDARRILIGGSGDSLFAALSVAPALRRWTGKQVEARSAIELARYESPLLGPGDVVISVSNSGSSSRARECVLLAKDAGALTVGVTGSMTGILARQADRVVHRPVAELPMLPAHYGRCFLNFAEYLAVLYALYSIGLALGQRCGHITPGFAAQQLAGIEAAMLANADIAQHIEPQIVALTEDLGAIDTLWVIGAGPGRGTAQYCAAKFHEQMPINGIGGDLEEWAHLEYFLTLNWGARSVVTVIAAPGNSYDRAQEIVHGITGAGGRAIVVHGGGPGDWSDAYAAVDLGHHIDEWLAPITFHLPSQLQVLHMAARAGIPFLPMRRHDEAWLIAKGIVRASRTGLE